MEQPEAIVGRPTEEAVEAILARDSSRDRAHVREALDPVSENGVVTEAAVESAVSDTAKVVSTAETRVELAGMEFAETREAASDVADLDVVAARLDEAAERLAAVESRADDLATDLGRPVDRLADPAVGYELAVELREVASAAQGVVVTADDLGTDLEQVGSWVETPARRYDEFREDVEHTGESLADLEAAVEAIPEKSDSPALDWADATMRVRVLAPLVADLRAELDDLRAWAERTGDPFPGDLDSDLDALAERRRRLVDRVDELARPDWVDRFDGTLADLSADLDTVDTPVDWAAVQATYETHRDRAFDGDG